MRQYAAGRRNASVKAGASSLERNRPPSTKRTAKGTVEPSAIRRSAFSTRERMGGNSTFPEPDGPPRPAGYLLGYETREQPGSCGYVYTARCGPVKKSRA